MRLDILYERRGPRQDYGSERSHRRSRDERARERSKRSQVAIDRPDDKRRVRDCYNIDKNDKDGPDDKIKTY